MPVECDERIREVLDHSVIAVVGCSRIPGKAAHDVPRYLEESGYRVVPVNPNADEVFGRDSVDTLSSVEESIDVVCIFRPSEAVRRIVEEAIGRDDLKAVWTQCGIRDDEAAAKAETAGLTVVQNRCMKVEHRRLMA